MSALRTAAEIRHEAVKADIMRLVVTLPESQRLLFWRIHPLGLDHLTDDKLASAHALVVRSVQKLEAARS